MVIISFEAELQCELTKIFLPKKLTNKQKKNLHLDIIVETRVVIYSCRYSSRMIGIKISTKISAGIDDHPFFSTLHYYDPY